MKDALEQDSLTLEPEYAQEFADLFGPDCDKPQKANPRFIFQRPEIEDIVDPGGWAEEMSGLVDEFRQLYTDAGLRPYRVFSVVYSWSGGEEGKGDLDIVSEREFLPRPLVDTRETTKENTEAGERFQGTAKLTEVSPRMTEDEILAYFPEAPLPRGHFAFIEVRMDLRDGGHVIRKRYTVKDPPYRNAAKFYWEVRLLAQQMPRTREGDLEAPQLYPTRLRPTT